MQKYSFFISISLFSFTQLFAQIPEDALRASWTMPSGTARQQAIGGAMGSLGGEITAGFVNPAGLGLYKTSEFVISPGMRFLMDKSRYLGNGSSASAVSNYNMGPTGLVFSYEGRNGGNNVFVIAVNRMANFNSNIFYQGKNAYSSAAEQYAEEFSRSGVTPDQGLSDPGLSYGTRMGLYTYLIDTATVNGSLQVIAQPNKAGLVNQANSLRSKGGITEIGLSLATNVKDHWQIGGTLGIPIMSYTRYQTYTETDATGNTNNDFANYTYQETYTSKGFGFNGKVGVLFTPGPSWRFGFALHTPTIYGVTDKISASMVTNLEGYTNYKQKSISSDSLDMMAGTSGANSVDYNMYTPWKFILSGSYVFGGRVEDVKRQKGFVTADLEYITTNTSKFTPANNDNSNGTSDNSYYDAVNSAIKYSYKGTLGARVGGELKLNTLMVRAGFAYYTNPYKDSELKADRLYLTTGVGYRNRGMFVDLAYVQQFSRDISFPYRLSDKTNTAATLKEIGGTIMLTAGIKF
jgi:hypothetical protein